MKLIILLAGLTGISPAAESYAPGNIPKGLASSKWQGVRDAFEAGRHSVDRQNNGTLESRDPGQPWSIDFEGIGFTVTPDHGAWTKGLELIGYGQRTRLPASSSISHEGGKTACRRADEMSSAPRIPHLATRGNLLSYGGIEAWDANPKNSPSAVKGQPWERLLAARAVLPGMKSNRS